MTDIAMAAERLITTIQMMPPDEQEDFWGAAHTALHDRSTMHGFWADQLTEFYQNLYWQSDDKPKPEPSNAEYLTYKALADLIWELEMEELETESWDGSQRSADYLRCEAHLLAIVDAQSAHDMVQACRRLMPNATH